MLSSYSRNHWWQQDKRLSQSFFSAAEDVSRTHRSAHLKSKTLYEKMKQCQLAGKPSRCATIT